jgi:hypothetical protein
MQELPYLCPQFKPFEQILFHMNMAERRIKKCLKTLICVAKSTCNIANTCPGKYTIPALYRYNGPNHKFYKVSFPPSSRLGV